MKIIFAGTPAFACPPLEALLEHHQVLAVFTQPDRPAGRGKKLQAPPVKKLALEHGIPVHQPDTLRDQSELIAAFDPDVMVVVAYGMILPKSILALPRLGCLNIHASLLPRWRGAAPIQRAIEAGDSETGVSIMQMEAGLDTGPVFEMLTTPIQETDTSGTLHDRLSGLGAKGIISTLSQLEKNSDFNAEEQNDDQANYANKITKPEAELEWNSTAHEIDCKVRAFIPWPICQTHHKGSRLRIWQASTSNLGSSEKPGTVISVENGIHVACGEGTLTLERIQRDGSKPLQTGEFLNGYSLAVGDHLSD